MKYLITGRAGSGKSALNTELNQRQINSLDTDKIPGLARWEDLQTGRPTHVDPVGFVDWSKVGWNWNGNVLKGILGTRRNLFLCGSASNQLEFHELFDQVYVLDISPDTQRQRLNQRPERYGKDLAMQEVIIEEQAEFLKQAVDLGAVAIDNNRPIVEVVDEILEIAHVK